MISAFNIEQAGTGILPQVVPTTGLFTGRNIHFSTMLCGLGALASLISILAGIALSQTSLMVTGGFYFIITSVAAYYTHTFSQYKKLESHIGLLQGTLEQYEMQITSLKATTTQVDSNLKELVELRVFRDKSHREHVNELKDLEEKFKKTIATLQLSEKNLQKQLDNVENLLTEKTKQFEKVAQDLAETATIYKIQLLVLSKKIAELKVESTHLSDLLDKAKTINTLFSQSNETYIKQNEKLKTELKQLSLSLSNTPERLDLEKLDKRTEKLGKIAESLKEKTSQIEDQIAKAQDQFEKNRLKLLEMEKDASK